LFGDAERMAQNYGNLIHRMLGEEKKIYAYGLHGLTEDGWFSENAFLAIPNSTTDRFLEFSIHIPDWIPGRLNITLTESKKQVAEYSCDHGKILNETLVLPLHRGIVEIRFFPAYTPASLGIAEDKRALSASCEFFRIMSSDGALLFDARH
jgi:hypothetical protein